MTLGWVRVRVITRSIRPNGGSLCSASQEVGRDAEGLRSKNSQHQGQTHAPALAVTYQDVHRIFGDKKLRIDQLH